MPQEISIDLVSLFVGIFTSIIFLVSVLLIYLTFVKNNKFHKQKLLNDLVSDERVLKIKLNEYQEKIENSKSKDEKDRLWNDHDNLMFNFYEYLGMLIINESLIDLDSKMYFQKILINVYRSFVDDKGFFSSTKVTRTDYVNLMRLFKRWRIDDLYVKVGDRE